MTCLAVSALSVVQVGLDTTVLMAFVVIMAFFRSASDPTFAAMIPSLFRHPDLRQVINGLFDSTRRTARVFGPTIAVVASSFLAPSRFFLVQAIGFIASALCIRRLPDLAVPTPPRTAGFKATSLLRSRDYAYVFLSQAINNGVWVLVFSLAAVIYFRERNHGVAGFGSFILCYGIGNVAASVAAASVPIRRPMPWIAMGRIVTGIGTMSLFLSEGTSAVYASAVLAALGTPFADLAFLQKIQSGNPLSSDIKAAVRLKMLSEWSGFILVSAASSWVLGSAGFGTIGLVAGGLLVATGVVGVTGTTRTRSPAGSGDSGGASLPGS